MAETPARYALYLEHKTSAEAAFSAAGLTLATVTANVLEVESAARHGVLVFPPPDIVFPSYEIQEVDFEAIAIAGPPDNLDHAWQTLDRMIDALVQANIDLKDAQADMFTPPHSLPLAGYSITYNTQTTYKETTP